MIENGDREFERHQNLFDIMEVVFLKVRSKERCQNKSCCLNKKIYIISLISEIFIARYSLFNIALIIYACD